MILLVLALLGVPAFAETGETMEECLVCGKRHASQDFPVTYKGQSHPLCSEACLREYRRHEEAGTLDAITARIEPRAALFQEDSNPRPALSNLYLGIGLYILAGLVAGGLASYHAVQSGKNARSAFALGLTLNVLGLAIVWLRPGTPMPFTSSGLRKIPTTRAEQSCAACGAANHPSATRCSSCEAGMEPVAPSEVDLALTGKES